MSKRILIGAATVAALAIAAAGCGGGGGGEKLTKDEWAAKVNEICKDFNAKQKEIGDPESLEDVVAKGPKILDAFDGAIGKVEDLDAPDEIADTADEFVANGKEQRDLLEQLVDAAKAKDEAKVGELADQGSKLDDESDALARELGIEECTE